MEDKAKLMPSEYYSDCHVGYSTEVSKDLSKAEQLWKITEKTWDIEFKI